MVTIPFIKMHGTGNDFVIVDARSSSFSVSNDRIAELANRHTGIGFDQFIVLKKSTKADVFMQIINADGSEVNACGNATRCVASLLPEADVTIETKAGIYDCRAIGIDIVCVNMGAPKFDWQQIPISHEMDTNKVEVMLEGIDLPLAVCVNMGNPHVVFFVDENAVINLEQIGSYIENHPIFPERVNVSIARLLPFQDDAAHIQLNVWERGAGITLSCGTAACATLVAAVRRGIIPVNSSTIHLPGGELQVEWNQSENQVWMTGTVAKAFDGSFDL